MSAALEDNLVQFIETIGTFQSMKGSLDTKFYNGLKTIVNNAMKQVSDHTGEYLHNLHNLEDKKPDEDTLLKIIDNVPSCLSYEDDGGCLPIFKAVEHQESVQYVPLLAKEGVKHNVGGDDARGRLLENDDVIENVLKSLVYMGCCRETVDPLCLDVMKKLRESKPLFEGRYSRPRPFVLCMPSLVDPDGI
jgi:hypothetical protein